MLKNVMHRNGFNTNTVAYIWYKLTMILLFCPFHSDDAFCAFLPKVIGTLSSEDGDGRKNVAKKVNSRSFNLYRDYSKSLTLSNVGKPP